MKKTWTYNNRDYVMVKLSGYGQYTLNGLHCTNSFVWDWCDDDSDEDKMMQAWKEAEIFVSQYE